MAEQGAPASPPETKERERQTAVAPLNTIAPEDIGEGAAKFDQWLREISDGYITLKRLSTVAGSLPVIGNIMALIDVVTDIVTLVRQVIQKKSTEFLDWVSLGINLIGVLPLPATAAARMSLRPALHLVRQQFNSARNVGEALIAVLVSHLNDTIAGEIDKFAQGAVDKLPEILEDCAKKAEAVIDDLISVLRRCTGGEDLFRIAAPVTAESAVYNPKKESTWARMLAAADRYARQTANYAVKVAASRLPASAKAVVETVIRALTDFKGLLREQLTAMASAEVEKSIMWLLQHLLAASRAYKVKRAALVPHKKGSKVEADRSAGALGANGNQAPAKGNPDPCKNCPAPAKKGGAISLATGRESFSHSDFVLAAPLPIAWTRTYTATWRPTTRAASAHVG
ncbi:DUF6531 domain-containing protein [Variovorax rhizosphaerae]|uniref:DUF6531 domain-containing protein n=1 Tax=Variovorax rhizosphaerae TaxID=1836200 RepID=A0ABU8WX05_9BURK